MTGVGLVAVLCGYAKAIFLVILNRQPSAVQNTLCAPSWAALGGVKQFLLLGAPGFCMTCGGIGNIAVNM